MKTTKVLNLFILCLFCGFIGHSQDKKIENLINKLSLEDKERLVVGSEMEKNNNMTQEAGVGETEDKVPGAAGTSLPIPALGNKKVVLADGPAGIRINPKRATNPDKEYYATAFPVASMLASSFNKPLLYEVGERFGDEAKEFGVDILLAPGMNIHRNPLAGRNFEYYSEDPVLSGYLGVSFTKGVQSRGIGVSLKHFVANNQETNRSRVNAIIGERALREIYLRGFEIAVKNSDPWTVMSAYNKVNGQYASESYTLLNIILREEWGFNGFVMTDWFAGEDPIAQLKAGNDLLMPGVPENKGAIVAAVKSGELSETQLNKNVRSILNIYTKTPTFLNYKASGSPDLEKSSSVALKAAIEGCVLLKNENKTLPLNHNVNIGTFGVASYETIAVGTGSGNVNMKSVVSLVDGLEHHCKISTDTKNAYAKYLKEYKENTPEKAWSFGPDPHIPEKQWEIDELQYIVKQTNIGVFTISRTSGEFYDRKQGADFYLTEREQKLLQDLSNAYHDADKKLVVVLNIGGVIETNSWKHYADAILLAWQPGQEGGEAIAQLLTGKENPSGKLPMTFPIKYMDHYSSKNFPGDELEDNPNPNPFQGVKSEVIYEEGIYVGYRYFTSFDVPVSFPFGYGLSYTQFEFKNLEVQQLDNGFLNITCEVKNVGATAGKEVVQLYVSSPNGLLEKPSIELREFDKTKILAPGATQKVAFKLAPKDYASYSSKEKAWVLEAGKYQISVGNSSSNLELSQEIVLSDFRIVEKIKAVLTPNKPIDELTE